MKINIQEYMKWLGMAVTDTVSGLPGVVASVSFDLYGEARALVVPDADGTEQDRLLWFRSCWVDVSRLIKRSPVPVAEVPNYGFTVVDPAPKEDPRLVCSKSSNRSGSCKKCAHASPHQRNTGCSVSFCRLRKISVQCVSVGGNSSSVERSLYK